MFPAEDIPETIGSYRILRRLAPAGPAEVYLARNEGPLGFARECELKLLPDTSDGSAGFAEELAREAAICARMNHPAVVRVFDFFEHQGKLVLAMEHVEGTTLGELIQWLAERRQKLGDAAVFHVGARIAGAIADAHAATDEQGRPTPIVHRNLTPDHVLIALDGEVRLTGFGVGKIVGRTPDTAIGKIKGTPGFMAPEQARGEPVTTKADVYGLGLLLWSLLAGRRPPTDGTWPRRVSGLRSDLPREVAAVVDAALDHFPGTRKISAREIEQWLTKAAAPTKGKAELKERVAALRGEAGRESEAPPPPSRKAPSSSGNPFQGVRFGPQPEGGVAPRAARRAPEPRLAEPQRTPTGAALARVVLALPPPPPPDNPAPPIETPPAPPAGTPPPAEATPMPAPRFGSPPRPTSRPDHTPAPPRPTSRPDHPPVTPAPAEAAAIPPAPPATEAEREPTPDPAPPALPAGTALPQSSLAPPAPKRLSAEVPRPSILGMQPPPSLDSAVGPALEVRAQAPAERIAPAPRAARKPGSLLITVAVSAATASVVAIGLYLLLPRGGAAPQPSPAASASIATIQASSMPPAPVASAAASAAAPEVDAGGPATPSANPADLPYGFGYLTVTSPATANVYLSGKIAGAVNQPLRVRCGRWFVRLAAPPESRYPEWVSAGETVVVACQQATRVDLSAPR